MPVQHAPNDAPPQRRRWSRRRIILLSILLLLASPFLGYAALAARFYTGKPSITKNFATEFQSVHAHHTDDERSWTILLELHSRWDEAQEEILDAAAVDGYYGDIPGLHTINAGHALFPMIAEHLRQSPSILDMAYNAAGRSVIGQPVTFDVLADTPDQYLTPDPDPSNQPPLYFSLLPWISHARTAHAILSFDFNHALGGSDPERAVQSIRSMLSLAQQARGEPLLLAGQVSSSMDESTADLLLLGLVSHPNFFESSQLDELQTMILEAGQGRIDFRAERRLQDDVLQRVFARSGRLTPAVMNQDISVFLTDGAFELPTDSRPFRLLIPVLALLVGSREEHETYFEETIRLAELAADNPALHYRSLFLRGQTAASLPPSGLAKHLFCHLIEPGFEVAVEQHIHTQTSLQAAATRLALERHKLATGHYPGTLTQLVPTYLPELPADPFNPGHPLNYLLRDNQPILYSVGSNGIDNNATLTARNSDAANLEARFANPNGPSPDAPEADWILSPPQD